MNFTEITWEKILAWLFIASGVVGALWKSLPPFLAWWESRSKNKIELIKLDRSETADIEKAKLEHDFKISELADKKLWAMFEQKEEENAFLRQELDKYEESEKRRGILFLEKLRRLREMERDTELIEIAVLKGEPQDVILIKTQSLKNQVIEYEKLLA